MSGEAGHNEPDEAQSSETQAGQDTADSPVDDVAVLRERLAEAEEQSLRLAAEFDNFRKRSQREMENARKYGIERLAAALLPVCDSLEAALSAENLEVQTLLDGQRATLRLLGQALSDFGVEQIDPHGEPFDPNRHEAMSMLPVPNAEPDSIVEVIQKGYAIADRLLRPARVIVAQAVDANGD